MNLQTLIEQLIILFAIIFLGWGAVKIGLLPKTPTAPWQPWL